MLATGRGLRAAAAGGCERAFVCAVDMPSLSADLIDVLAGYREADVVLPWDGREHYLAGIYRTHLAAHIDALVSSGERRMRSLTETVVSHRVVLPANSPVALTLSNVNSEADLRRAD